MEPDSCWTFEQYRTYEQNRAERSELEQREARITGLVADPKTAPHGGYRIACNWSNEVTQQAHELSSQLAELLPGTPAYPFDSIHSSLGNLRPEEDRLVDPGQRDDDRAVLDRLCDATESALKTAANGGLADLGAAFGPAFVAPRMAYVFGRPQAGYWNLTRTVQAACSSAGVEMAWSWGPHLTLTRFGEPTGPELAAKAIELVSGWQPVPSAPASIIVGYYTVSDGAFHVTTYRWFPLG